MAADLTNAKELPFSVLSSNVMGWAPFATEGHGTAEHIRRAQKVVRAIGIACLLIGSAQMIRTFTVEDHTGFRVSAIEGVAKDAREMKATAAKIAMGMAPVPAEVARAADHLPKNDDVYGQDKEIAEALRSTGKLPPDLDADKLGRKDWLAGDWKLGKAAVWQPNDKTIFVGAYTEDNEYRPGRWVQVYRKGVNGTWYSRGLSLPNTWTIEGGEMSPSLDRSSVLKPTDVAMTITGEE
ncbi:MAG: hypothetical protein H7Y60_06515 [Rhodospirillaceae bacterium]|nr:hypothetical protein [Rhodospirillales bacterium]